MARSARDAVGRLVGLVPSVRRTRAQVPRHAATWADANATVLAGGGSGPLWVVLGDSAAQAVGAADVSGGYVGRLLRRLEERDGSPWRVVNLSVSGARTRDVLEEQVPRLDAVTRTLRPPHLVTALVGGNDATHTPVDQWLRDVDALCAALPAGAVVATVPRGWRERKARVVNARVRDAAATHGLRVADLWAHTGPPYRGRYADGFHPNERGYAQWADALAACLGLPVQHGPRGAGEPQR